MAPVVAVGIIGCVAAGTELDILALGDDTASVLGVHVRRVRVLITLLTVLLSAAAVTVAGPVGFVGLVAPVLVRLIAPLVPGLLRHRVLLPLAGWPAYWSCSVRTSYCGLCLAVRPGWRSRPV